MSEGNTPAGTDEFQLIINVRSQTTSESDYQVLFRWLEGSGTAVVEAINTVFDPEYDARFGSRLEPDLPIEDSRILAAGDLELRTDLITFVRNDFVPEDQECYTLRILSPDIVILRDIFDCKEDNTNPVNFFCLHTVCIDNDDG